MSGRRARAIRNRLLALAGAMLVPVTGLSAAGIVIDNVTVIDTSAATADQARLAGQTVVIEDGRIVRVEPAATAAPVANARRIDGSGRFLIPALWDSHVHIAGPEAQKRATLLLFVANGVTSVRDMGHDSSEDAFAALRRDIAAGKTLGPRVIGSPFRIAYGGNTLREYPEALESTPRVFFVDTAKDGRDLVRYARKHRLDFIKPYDLVPRAAFFPMMDEARKQGVTVSGHVPMAVTVREAAEAGMASLEHARSLPFNCAPAGDDLLRRYDRATADRDATFDGGEIQNDGDFLRAVVTGFDAARCAPILAAMAKSGMVYVPTHVTRRMDALARQLEFRETPLLRYIHPDVRAGWQEDLDYYAAKPAATRAVLMDFYYLGLDITRRAAEAGVKILVGTDASDTYIVPGFSMHQEMYEMVGGGLTPIQVLRAATLSPAEFAGESDRRGTIAAGKVADLVLLTADPLADIANTRHIDAVIHDGAVIDRAALDQMLENAAALVAAKPDDEEKDD
jgi:imidazolonepropionase-like amidohydrolase